MSKLLSCTLLAALVAVSPSFAQDASTQDSPKQNPPAQKVLTVTEQALITAAAQPEPQSVQIRVKHTGQCLAIAGYSYNNGASLIQSACSNSDNQKFIFTPAAERTWFITVKHSGLVLDVDGVAWWNNARIHQWALVGATNQRWRLIQADGDDYYYITSFHSEKAMDVLGGRYNPGTPLVQYSLHGGWNQRFALVPVK